MINIQLTPLASAILRNDTETVNTLLYPKGNPAERQDILDSELYFAAYDLYELFSNAAKNYFENPNVPKSDALALQNIIIKLINLGANPLPNFSSSENKISDAENIAKVFYQTHIVDAILETIKRKYPQDLRASYNENDKNYVAFYNEESQKSAKNSQPLHVKSSKAAMSTNSLSSSSSAVFYRNKKTTATSPLDKKPTITTSPTSPTSPTPPMYRSSQQKQ
jgi:hypothetical protein